MGVIQIKCLIQGPACRKYSVNIMHYQQGTQRSQFLQAEQDPAASGHSQTERQVLVVRNLSPLAIDIHENSKRDQRGYGQSTQDTCSKSIHSIISFSLKSNMDVTENCLTEPNNQIFGLKCRSFSQMIIFVLQDIKPPVSLNFSVSG